MAQRRRARPTPVDDGWRIHDALCQRIDPLLPRELRPLGCHNPRVPDRAAVDTFFQLRTGCQ